MADPFEAKPMVLKELRGAPTPPEPAKKRRAPQQQSSQSNVPAKPKPAPYVTSSGRHSVAVTRESPDPSDPSSSKKKYEKRVKVSCSTCGKSIARKAEDAGQETFSAYRVYQVVNIGLLTALPNKNRYAAIAHRTPAKREMQLEWQPRRRLFLVRLRE